jgi:transposase
MKKIQAKKIKTVNEKRLIATVDIGKVKNMGYCRCPDGREIKPFEFFNNGHGFNEFWKRICQTMKIYNLEEVVVGFESTGPYGETLIHYLRKRKIDLVQVNPMHTKKLKELNGNSPNKTDKKDPKVIADIIELGYALTLVIPEGAAADLRRLAQARERSIKRRTSLWNQIQDNVFVLFPEFLQVMKDVKTKSAQYLLKHYPAPSDLIEYGLAALTSVLKKISRGKLDKKRAKSLYEAAKASVGIKEGRESILLEIRNILALIEMSDRFIAEIEQKMSYHLEQIPYSRFILSLKGIGEITAAGLIGEVGDFSKFNTISEITKLAGLDLFEISSGKHKGIHRISKRGRPLMRKLLFFAAINVVRKGGIMHKQYQRYLKRGMIKMKALIAISRKLLALIFALVRDHNEYVIDYAKRETLLKDAA